MNQQAVEAYIDLLPYNDVFTELIPEAKTKLVFGASEMLRRRYGAAVITDEMVALQALYVAEGEKEEFAKFKRHNVTNMQVEDLRFGFMEKGELIVSPEVIALIEQLEVTAVEAATFFGRLF